MIEQISEKPSLEAVQPLNQVSANSAGVTELSQQKGKSNQKPLLILAVTSLMLLIFLLICGFVWALVRARQNNTATQSCNYQGINYDNGIGFPSSDGCNSCSCAAGQVVCTEMACFNPTETPAVTKMLSNQPTVTYDQTEQKNTLYLAELNGQKVIYTRVQGNWISCGDAAKPAIYNSLSAKNGFQFAGDPSCTEFASLSQAQRILEFSGTEQYDFYDYYQVDNFLYVSVLKSVNLASLEDHTFNEVYQVDLTTLQKQLLWTREIGDAKYASKGPIQFLPVTTNKYVVMNVLSCWSCGPETPDDVIILNIATKKESLAERATNIILGSGQYTFKQYIDHAYFDINDSSSFATYCHSDQYWCGDGGSYWKLDNLISTRPLP
ncbi:MAG: hypothetical protein WCJ58_00340 [bacterium]